MSDTHRVAVIPGEGAVIRQGTTLVVIGGAVSSAPQLVDQLTATIADFEGAERVRQLARLVLNVDVPPPVAVVTLDGDAASIFLHGDVELVWPTVRVSGSDHVLGMTQVVPIADGFWIGAGIDEAPPLPSWSNLVNGAVSRRRRRRRRRCRAADPGPALGAAGRGATESGRAATK